VKKQIILLTCKLATSKLSTIINKDDLCYLFSKDYALYVFFNRLVPKGCKVFNQTLKIISEIDNFRSEYLMLFTKLDKRYDSKEWWGSNIASRNSATIPLQLNIIYLICAKRIIDEFNSVDNRNSRLILIADSPALLHSIQILGDATNIDVYYPRKTFINTVFTVKLLAAYFYRINKFIFQSYKISRDANSKLKPLILDSENNKNFIIIRSWITKGTLKHDSPFIDRNFGHLPLWLQSKGYEVIIFPLFFNIDNPIKVLSSFIKKHDIQFLIQDHYLKWMDYVTTIYSEWRQINIDYNNIGLNGIDLTLLFQEVKLHDGFNIGRLSYNLCYPLFKRLRCLDFNFDKIYYPFENNAHEKSLIRSCNQYYPKSEVIGYQHTVWYGNQLGMFLGDNEDNCHPIPDKIIYGGPIYFEILKKAGFPTERLLSGPNLRFTSVYKGGSILKHNIAKPNILLPLTFDNDLAYELIHKIKIVSKYYPELFIYIRRHPLLNKNKLTEFLNNIKFDTFQYADEGDLQDWLFYTDIVISTGGSISIVEAVASGVPVIRVKPDNNIFLDPLAWLDYPIRPVNNIKEITDSIKNIVSMNKKEYIIFQNISNQVLYDYFTVINENTMKVFN
jgi:hypothetical protein